MTDDILMHFLPIFCLHIEFNLGSPIEPDGPYIKDYFEAFRKPFWSALFVPFYVPFSLWFILESSLGLEVFLKTR